jgi:hypothetical protein
MPDAAEDTRSAVAAVADTLAADLEVLAGRWRAGTLNDSDFRIAMARAIKRGHVAAAAVAAGGKANLTPADLGAVGSKLRQEYTYLDKFVRGVDDPSAYDNAAARAAMYGRAILATYEDTRRRAMRAGGATQERRVLGLTAGDHCDPCVSYAAMGWQPAGTLPGVGEACDCKSNCHCSFRYDGGADVAEPGPPGPIGDRIAADTVAAAVYREVLAVAERHEALIAAAQRDVQAANEAVIAALWDRPKAEKQRDYAALQAADEALAAARAARDPAIRAALATPNPTPIGQVPGSVIDYRGRMLAPLAPEVAAGAEAGRAFVSSLLQQGNGAEPFSIPIGQARPGDNPRPYHFAGTAGSYIQLGPADRAAVAAHELGHALEDRVRTGEGTLKDRAREFLEYRVGDEPLRSMNEARPGRNYGPDERGRKDGFDRAFGDAAWYVGKHYADGSTEITSMGLQKLYEDAAGFARADPEYFKFMVGVLRGTLR